MVFATLISLFFRNIETSKFCLPCMLPRLVKSENLDSLLSLAAAIVYHEYIVFPNVMAFDNEKPRSLMYFPQYTECFLIKKCETCTVDNLGITGHPVLS